MFVFCVLLLFFGVMLSVCLMFSEYVCTMNTMSMAMNIEQNSMTRKSFAVSCWNSFAVTTICMMSTASTATNVHMHSAALCL